MNQPPDIMAQLVGQSIGGFLLLRELGRGNNGVVYLAKQELLEREVAFKVLLPERAAETGFLQGFLREARNAAKLNHPHVVQAIDAGTSPDGWNYFVMEYVDGESVENIRLRHPEDITLRFVLHLSQQLASALDYAWQNFHMTHGDIKPDNLMIRHSDHSLKLADLGLARAGGGGKDEEVMATPLYAAPEVISRTASNDVRSDIYSYGITLYELFCGVTPFRGDVESVLHQHLETAPEPLIRKNPDMDPAVAAMVDRMLAKNPDDRPQNWSVIGKFFRETEQRLCVSHPKTSVSVPFPLEKKKIPGNAGIIMLVLLAVLLLISLLLLLRFLLA